jgi:hypothetical protein
MSKLIFPLGFIFILSSRAKNSLWRIRRKYEKINPCLKILLKIYQKIGKYALQSTLFMK